MKRFAAFLTLLLLAGLGFCVAYFLRGGKIGSTTVSAPSAGTFVQPPTPQAPTRSIRIYTVAENGGGDENDLKPVTIALDTTSQPARFAIDSLISATDSPLPAGTKLQSIKIDDGLATVDFSKQLQSNFHGSDTQEAQAVNSILMTLGQFPSIRRVQILVDGAPIESLGGHFEISDPLDVITVGNAQVRQASASGASRE
jgi:germination protein M